MNRKSFVLRVSLVILQTSLLAGVALAGEGGTEAPETVALKSVSPKAVTPQKINFSRDVRPILHQHCVACHGGVKQAGDLSFVYEEQALTVIEPGEPDDSDLMDRVLSDEEDYRMPPAEHGPPLSAEEIKTLRAWIQQGAKWQGHWAFEPPQKTAPPSASGSEWPRERIDYFILDRLAQAKINPSPDAASDRWQRRVSLDLIGLPPTLEERSKFLAAVDSEGEAAYQAEVDRLLASPHYGERWASLWLDVVRYADSKGLGTDRRRTVWSYRDWVIRSLNQDMPYDQFTIKQIGGDLLPEPEINDLVATACHRLTQTNEEGGTDDEQFRVEAVLDRVNTTWQAWQGLTFGCTQCHSHPYDPIQHEEYYQFLAFFNNTADADLYSDAPQLRVPLDESQFELASQLDRQIKAIAFQDWQAGDKLLKDKSLWQPLTEMQVKSSNHTKIEVEKRKGREEFRTRGTVSRDTNFTIEAPLPAPIERLTAIRFTGLPLDPETARKDSEWGFVISHFVAELIPPKGAEPIPLEISRVLSDELEPIIDPQLSLNPEDKSGFGAFSRINFSRSAAFVLKTPVEVPEGSRIRVTLKQNRFIVDAFSLVVRRGQLEVTGSDKLTEWLGDEVLVAARKQVARLKKKRTDIESTSIPIMRERPEAFARPSHVFTRGNYLAKAQKVQPRTPGFLPALKVDQEQATRLDLAKWIASSENPLTARVMVNRMWAGLFGIGLVETQEDFGSSGHPPSHPELLDDLAVRFSTDMDWSIKQLLRELTLSSAYRQSARTSKDRLAKDPRNRLLSRGPRNRLAAEMVRDQSLAISGLLSKTLLGPPVHPPIPSGVWKPFARDLWNTPKPGHPDRYRRSIYTYTKRSIPYPMFDSFDLPSREFCTPRRMLSNTPLQALMTLNDAAFVEASEALARRMLLSDEQREKQIEYGFLLATCRQPTLDEVEELVALYSKSVDELQKTDSQGEKPREILGAIAMSNVASVLLNLDEVLCK